MQSLFCLKLWCFRYSHSLAFAKMLSLYDNQIQLINKGSQSFVSVRAPRLGSQLTENGTKVYLNTELGYDHKASYTHTFRGKRAFMDFL